MTHTQRAATAEDADFVVAPSFLITARFLGVFFFLKIKISDVFL